MPFMRESSAADFVFPETVGWANFHLRHHDVERALLAILISG